MESKKIEESATRSHSEVPAPTPGQLEKARAFCRAWPVADRAFPDFTVDRSPSTDAPIALAQMLADESHEALRLVDQCREGIHAARAEAQALQSLVRLAAGALSDLVQLGRRADVRRVLNEHAAPPLLQVQAAEDAARLGGPVRVTCAGCGASDLALANAPAFPGWPVPWGWSLYRSEDGRDQPDAFCERCTAPKAIPAQQAQAERIYRAALGVEIPEQSSRLGLPEGQRETIVQRINRLARERDQARAERDARPAPAGCKHDPERTWSIASGHADWCPECGALRIRSPGSGCWRLPAASVAPVHSECPDGSCLYGLDTCARYV